MNTAHDTTSVDPAAKPAGEDIAALAKQSARQALLASLVLILLGHIAFEIVGGLARDMTPSLPSFLTSTPPVEAGPAPAWRAWWATIEAHQFPILFAVIFTGCLGTRLAMQSGRNEPRMAAGWVRRVAGKLSERWFGMIVGNAFGAFITASVLEVVQQFSISKMIGHWVWGICQPLVVGLTALFLGAHQVDTLRGWFAWYDANQMKFTFWLLYGAAICDDLGLPNLKTLGRRIWRWFGERKTGAAGPARPSPDSANRGGLAGAAPPPAGNQPLIPSHGSPSDHPAA